MHWSSVCCMSCGPRCFCPPSKEPHDLTGDLDQIPRVVAAELSTWLEANKHINEWHAGKEGTPPEGTCQQEGDG
jgi:hypothetical protein